MKPNKLSEIKKDIYFVKRGLQIIHQLQPNLLLLYITKCIFDAIFPFINIYMSSEIIEKIINKADINVIIQYAIITVVLNFLVTIISRLLTRVINVKYQVFKHNYSMSISNKVLDMDYESVENFEVHNLKQKIYDSLNLHNGGIYQLLDSFAILAKVIFTIIFSVAITLKLFIVTTSIDGSLLLKAVCSPIYAIVLIVLIIFSVILSMKTHSSLATKTYSLIEGLVEVNRKTGYYASEYLSSYHAGKDIRLYAQNEVINDELDCGTNLCVKTLKQMINFEFKTINLNTLMTNIVNFLINIFIVLKAYIGLFGAGNIVKYIGSISQFITGVTLFMNEIAKLKTNNTALQYYYDFIDIPNNKYMGTLPVEKRDDNEYEIEFKNVSFKYPNTKEYALKNFSFKLKIGERLAIVGMNGSGKTTMIKLLCRLYDPTEGVITLNGIDIRKYDYDEYLNIFSVVFQDFNMFSFSLGENVAANVDYNKEKALAALEESGFGTRYKKMSNGLDTSLYKDFNEDGVEVSGGEAQKIAIARAIYKNAPFIVLDEPTAALDPISEAEVYSKFNEIVEGRTAIYVSHRLSSCRFCDNIAVFNQGQLIQQGNHDKLIQDTKGKYYELWCAQAQYYA